MNATEILSDEHRELLDVIDSLRSQNFSRYVDLPQIIVCGDQSAGKSSVLEAISSMRFPTKDGLCTRFATELVLRRGSEKSPKVSILPGGDRYGDEKNQIAEWTPAASIEADGLEAVTEEAKQRMATPEPKRFYNDILRIEVTGPTQPHLTMVDLPGLFRAGNSEQSDKDGEIVRDMVESYMARPRSIILAVVSAKNGYVLQEVTEMAKKADPEGRRTIGLITKPDTLDVGSDSETSYVKLAQNNDVKLRLGWHVLRNRNFEERNSSSDQRDKVEDEFFSHGIWADLNPSYCGVRALKDRLSSVLKDQIIEQLPSLVEDVEEGIRDCSTKLERLGPVRTTVTQKRRYLTQISDSYTFLMTQAVEGNYSHPFFGSSKRIEMYSRRLRAVVQNLLIDFAKSMHHSGKSQIIYEFEDESGARAGSDSTPIARSTYLENVTERLRYSRGRELPELFNPLIVGDLFLEQCKPWRSIASQLVEDILTVVKRTVEQLVDYIVPGDVAEGILRYLSDGIERLEVELASKIEAVIPLETSHPISYNDELGGLIRKAQQDRHKRALQKLIEETFGSKLQDPEAKISCNPFNLLENLLLKFETDMKDYGSSTAADAMEAYYKIALVRFIDDVSVLGIEHCLVAKLPTLMRPTDVLDMSDSELSRLASESPKSSRERTHLAQKRETLEKGLPVLKAFQSRRQNTFIIPVLVTEQPPSTIDQDSDAQSVGGRSVSAHSAATESSEEVLQFAGSLEQLQEDHIRSSRPYSMSPQLSKLAINVFQD